MTARRGLAPFRRGLALLGGSRLAALSLVVSNFLGGASEAAFLALATRLAFAVTEGSRTVSLLRGVDPTLGQTVLIGVGLIAVRVAFAVAAAAISARLTSRISSRARLRLVAAYFAAPWERQHGDRVGRLQEIVSGHSQRLSEFLFACVSWATAAANLMAILLGALALNAVASVGAVATVVLLGSILRPIRETLRRRAKSVSTASMTVATTLTESAGVALEVRVFHVQESIVKRLNERLQNLALQTQRVLFVRGLTPVVYSGLAFLALLIGLYGASTIEGLGLASVGAVMLLMLRSLSYGQALQTSTATANSLLPYLDEIDAELERLESAAEDHGREVVDHLGVVAFDSVGFSYDGVSLTLRDISFELRQREVVGVVGPSGSGKSTMVQLLLGLRKPSSGRVLAAGREISSYAPQQWARKVTFVPQVARLVSGSVADNIRFFREGVTDADIERAARLANLHDDVALWVDGYQHQVGEGGSRLSGGQMQRLVIARALVERPELLVLDEPTSSLDARSEHLVKETLARLGEQITVVVIAHRLSTLDICHRIMVIQAGELRAFDTPDNLSLSSSFYRDALRIAGITG